MKIILKFIALAIFLFFYLDGRAQSGIITTIAGNGTFGNAGDGGPATAAELTEGLDITTDTFGNTFFLDNINGNIRKIDASGIISTVPGNGSGITTDPAGNLFIAGGIQNIIQKLSPAGTLTTIAGDGTFGSGGDGGPATAAQLRHPYSISFDGFGNLYFSENGRIRKIDLLGIITTVAGNGIPGFSGDDGPATDASLYGPFGIAVTNSGNIYASCQDRIRKISPSGIITTVAGNGTHGYSGDGGPATAAQLYSPMGLETDYLGNVYIADYTNGVIRKLNSAGIISTFAGNASAYSGDGGPAIMAGIGNPYCIKQNVSGDFFIGAKGPPRIRKISSSLETKQTTLANYNISLSPNPTTGSFSLTGSINSLTTEDVAIQVANILGQTVYKNNISTQQGKINTKISLDNDLPNGIYLLHLSCGSENEVLRFVVEK